MGTDMDYPEEWNELPKHERKKKIKELKREQERKIDSVKKIRNLGLIIVIFVIVVVGFIQLTKKSPEQVKFEQQVEKFAIEGRNHVQSGTSVEYKTNPPTSGDHLAQAENWGVYDEEIDDKAGVHSMEHGGIWISYKDISEKDITVLKEIGKQNSQSTVISPRSRNDNKVVVTSWGKMMKLEVVDNVLIQKYIDTYKNQSPERLAK